MKKIIASVLAVFFVLLSPLSAFASTTESVIMFASVDDYGVSPASIPTNFMIPFKLTSYNEDTGYHTIHSGVDLVDGSSTGIGSYINLEGETDNELLGFVLGFDTNISGSWVSNHTIDFSIFDFRIFDSLNSNYLALSSYSVPAVCYARYTGTYEFQVYDGSVGYDRWIYNNDFSITKPVSVSMSNVGSYNPPNAGSNYSLTVPAISSADLLNVTGIRNTINSYTSLEKHDTDDYSSFEDYSYENIRMSVNTVTVYVLYSIDKTNFVPWDSSFSSDIPTDLSGCQLQFFLYPDPYASNLTSVNVRSVDYMREDYFSLKNIANGFASLASSLSSGAVNIVNNATDNANRIIQNTTQKIDEVKQGVTDVKNSVVETKNSILDLPNKIKDMLLGLIVPSSETMSNKFSEFSELLEDKLGIIYQVPMMLFDFFDTIVNAATTPQTTLTLPAFQLPWIDGSTLTVWQPMEYRIIPEGMQVLSDLIKTITSMTVVVLTFNSVKRAYERFLRS